MPLITGVDHDRREVSVIAIGPVSVDDVLEFLLHQKREHGLSYPRLVDLRGAGIPTDPAGFERITEMVRNLSLEGPIGPAAIVVSSDADVDSMRVLEGMLQNFFAMKTFRGEGHARAWLRGTAAKGQAT
jgi:hypothetical protein